MQFDDTARPRSYAIDDDYQIEVDHIAATDTTPAHIAPKNLVDHEGHGASDEELFSLALELRGYDGEDVEDALDALLGYALERDAAERHVAIAEEFDADEPIPFDLTDAPSDALDALVDWHRDPEAPEPWMMDGDHCDAFAAEQSLTGRTLRAHDRAAGGSR